MKDKTNTVLTRKEDKQMAKLYDPYDNVVATMEEAMEVGQIDRRMFDIIKNPRTL